MEEEVDMVAEDMEEEGDTVAEDMVIKFQSFIIKFNFYY
jgi:hypothetical protein